MRQLLVLFVIVLCLTAVSNSVQGQPTTFSDGTFLDSDWELHTFTFNGSGSVGASHENSGGNPGERRKMTVSSGANGVTAVFGISIRSAAVYNPSVQGAISFMYYSEDAAGIGHSGGTIHNNQATGIAVLQAGSFFIGGLDGYGFTPDSIGDWQTITFPNLVAADFERISAVGFDPTTHPDFSASGAPIQLGFVRAQSDGGSQVAYSISVAIDNWSVTVVPSCACTGDMDANGLLDGRDVSGFTSAVIAGALGCADVNHDLQANADDIGPFVNLLLTGATCN